jgi:hypothetical protein
MLSILSNSVLFFLSRPPILVQVTLFMYYMYVDRTKQALRMLQFYISVSLSLSPSVCLCRYLHNTILLYYGLYSVISWLFTILGTLWKSSLECLSKYGHTCTLDTCAPIGMANAVANFLVDYNFLCMYANSFFMHMCGLVLSIMLLITVE